MESYASKTAKPVIQYYVFTRNKALKNIVAKITMFFRSTHNLENVKNG